MMCCVDLRARTHAHMLCQEKALGSISGGRSGGTIFEYYARPVFNKSRAREQEAGAVRPDRSRTPILHGALAFGPYLESRFNRRRRKRATHTTLCEVVNRKKTLWFAKAEPLPVFPGPVIARSGKKWQGRRQKKGPGAF